MPSPGLLRLRIIFVSLALIASVGFGGLYGVYLYQTKEAEFILSHPNAFKGWMLSLACSISLPLFLIIGIVFRHKTPAWLELVMILVLFGEQLGTFSSETSTSRRSATHPPHPLSSGNCLYNFVIGEDFAALEACAKYDNFCQEDWGLLFASGASCIWLLLLFIVDLIAILGTNKAKVGLHQSVWKTPIGNHHATAQNGHYDHESLLNESKHAWSAHPSELYQPHQEIHHPTYHQQVPYPHQPELYQPKH